jgi:leucine dehydrogenase
MSGLAEWCDHEELVVRRGPRSGVPVIVAVHSTTLGPALGGCRMWPYASVAEAAADALRLSRAMTFKAAAAHLPLGGGKTVVCLPAGPRPAGAPRQRLLRDIADLLGALEGRYITAEDVGTSSADMVVIGRYTPYVAGRPVERGGSGDPGELTAVGVHAAMRAVCDRLFGTPRLEGRRVAVVGCGSVGERLARSLHDEGAELVLADIDVAKEALARELGARWLAPDEALRAEVDILAPCALGGVLDERTVGAFRCRAVCGSANNQLASDGIAELLRARGVLFAPDFIVNAGGVINVSLELTGYDRATAQRRAAELEQVLARVFDRAEREGTTPLHAAYALAGEWLAAGAPAKAA